MSQVTAIEWTDISWNPVHGCSKVSPGCAHCYAETLSRRYKQTLSAWTPANAAANVLLKPHKLREPLSNGKEWRGLGAAAAAAGMTDGKLVFVNSTSDLFHEEIPDEYIADVWATMMRADRHAFQVLTKRPERMRDLLTGGMWPMLLADAFRRAGAKVPFAADFEVPVPQNVWLGVSIENRRYVGRADVLRETPAAARFISAEPLIGPLVIDRERRESEVWWDVWPDGKTTTDTPHLNLAGIDWLIVGGESGHRHRPVDPQWVQDLRDDATEQGVAFLFKQWGGRTPKAGGRELDGRTWDEFPRAGSV